MRDYVQKAGLALILAGCSAGVQAQEGTWIDPPAQVRPPAAAPAPAPATPPAQQAAPPARPAPEAAAPQRSVPRAEAPPRTRTTEPREAAPARRRAAEPAPRAAPPPPVERRTAERRGSDPRRAEAAAALAEDYLETWSAPNGLALSSTTAFYAPRVRFHGRLMSAGEVLEEKRRFVRRWPERDYNPRLNTLGTACARESCTVRSVFDFRAANPAAGRLSQGIGTIELVVSFAGGRPVITAENSMVMARGREQRSSLEADDER